MHLTLTPIDPAAPAPAPFSNPALNALHDLIDVSSVLRMAIYYGEGRGASPFHLDDLARGLAAADRAKQYLHDQLRIQAPSVTKDKTP
jgi:hypothetical protein